MKKIIISIVIAILAIIGLKTTTDAYYVGQRVFLSYNDYEYSNTLYCVQHHQALSRKGHYFNVVGEVKIVGNTSTDHTGKKINSWHNAKLAYMLNGRKGGENSREAVRNAIWGYMRTWLSHVGSKHAGVFTNFSNGVEGNHTGDELEKEAEEYADLMKEENQKIKDKTDQEKVKVTLQKKGDKDYVKVGPINWEFKGQLQKGTVEDENGKEIANVKYCTYKGKEEQWHGIDKIKSGKDFYVIIPADTCPSKITKITGYQEFPGKKTVTIYFLEAEESAVQNLISIHPGGNPKPQIINTPLNYDIELLINLSGYVWIDGIDGKEGKRNNKFNDASSSLYDGNDKLLNGITVRLKDKTTGGIVRQTVTSSLGRYSGGNGDGEYLFEKVLIAKLGDYYVEFEYDGLTYTNVIPYISGTNTSKAAEAAASRKKFNDDFSIIEGNNSRNTGFTRNTAGDIVHNLEYELGEHKAELINNGQYPIIADTEQTGYQIINHYIDGASEIRNINLGLYEREQPDLAILKDLNNVRLTINGYEHTYTYSQRFLNAGEYDGNGFNVGVKFANKYRDMTYSRAIYKSDYEFVHPTDKSKDLKAYIIYEIKMRNEATSLTSQINSLVDYYDSKYELLHVGEALNPNGSVIDSIEHEDSTYNDQYKKTIIKNKTKLEAQTESSIYVEFLVEREGIINILNGRENLKNVVEINSYSTFENDEPYAGVDIDSAPANCIPGDESTYEDDTDSSPSLILEVADNARELAGKMFEDKALDENGKEVPTATLRTGQIRQGNGLYEDGEVGIPNVEITYRENTGSQKVYKTKTIAVEADKYGFIQDEETGLITPEAYKEENASKYLYTYDNEVEKDSPIGIGDFFIKTYIPGDYTVTYTWGDKTYTVQDYKGTIYPERERQQNREWYKNDVEKRLTDAMDNYNKEQDAPKGSRLQIDEEIRRMTTNTLPNITRTQMDSTTPTMAVGVEYDNVTTASSGDQYTYRIYNVDFGIIRRARQDLKLEKRVKTLKVTLANGQVVIDLEVDENGNLKGQHQYVTYMPPSPGSNPGNGFIKLELDNELMQGSILEVGYEFKTTNQGEVDYLSEAYYTYGDKVGDIISITPTGIIDYLDKGWAFDDQKNTQWKVLPEEEDVAKYVGAEVFGDQDTTARNKLVLYTEALKDKALIPLEGQNTATTDLNVSKILTTTDEISLDNETEMVELNRPGGCVPDSIPGNYIPGKGHTETDDYMAETVIVTPATGENLNYILPIVIGITSFIILGAGVVIIKKKVL